MSGDSSVAAAPHSESSNDAPHRLSPPLSTPTIGSPPPCGEGSRLPVTQHSAIQKILAIFPNPCSSLAIPPHCGGALRAIVTTREAGMRWPREIAASSHEGADERSLADVKSQRPDTPKLVSSAMRASALSPWWPTSRCTRETAYKRSTHRAGNAGVLGFACGTCRLHFFRRRAMGEAFTRHSLRPLHVKRDGLIETSGECRRETAMTRP